VISIAMALFKATNTSWNKKQFKTALFKVTNLSFEREPTSSPWTRGRLFEWLFNIPIQVYSAYFPEKFVNFQKSNDDEFYSGERSEPKNFQYFT